MPFYHNNPKFSSLDFMNLDDKELISFMRKEGFNVNKEWGFENPVLHLFLANEMFDYFDRFLDLIPQNINPNLCDGNSFGNKSLLIILTMLPSSDSLPLKFIDHYKRKLNLDYQDKAGRTALHYAVILGRLDLVDALTKSGASASIKDKDGLCAFDYLNCSKACISSVLKQVDIRPGRDVYATSNSLNDHLGQPLFWKGKRVTLDVNSVQGVLDDVKTRQSRLVEYIRGNNNWGTFIGDQSEATYKYLGELAQDIASSFNISLEEVLLDEELPSEDLGEFLDFLEDLTKNLSGVSVLDNCLMGHEAIIAYQESEKLEHSLSP